MLNKLTSLLKSIKQSAGIDAAAYSEDGALIYRTSDFEACDFTFPHGQKDILQPDGVPITVLPLRSGVTVLLAGTGEAYAKYAALVRAAVEMRTEESVKELSPAERLRRYLLGELDSVCAEELEGSYKGPFDCYVLTLVTDSHTKLSELKNFLEAMRERGDLIIPYDEHSVAYIKKCGEEDEYQSATDFAFTLYDNIKEEIRINCVVNVGGTVHSFSELRDYFHRCELAYAFGKMMTPNGKIYSYKEYILIKMLSEIPPESLTKYLGTLLDRDSAEILADTELMVTAEEFLKNSLNISETSRSMYMHRNTLIYRLDKIENATGLNLRHFNDAVAFRILTMLDKLVKNNGDKTTK